MTFRVIRTAAAMAAAATLLLGALAAATPALAASRACAGWVVRPSPSKGSATLHAVAATSGTDVWAVGSYNSAGAYKTLIEHWNGTRWTIVPSANPASG